MISFLSKSKLPIVKLLGILPQIGELIGYIVKSFEDKRLDEQEIKGVGERLVAIVTSAL